MAPSVLRRRVATAAGLYLSVALGILGTIAAARMLGLEDFGLFATVIALVGLAQTLLDLTVEESLTKFGFRYVAAEDWGRLRRLFRRALELKLVGGALASVILLLPRARSRTASSAPRASPAPMVAAAALPLLAAPENVSASALLLRGRYDLRGWLLSVTMGIRLVAILDRRVVRRHRGACGDGRRAARRDRDRGHGGRRRAPPLPARRGARASASDRREIVSFVVQSSVATGVISLRAALTPVLLGVVAGTTQVGYYRVALAPQSGFSAASAPVRLVLLTEQTRDWEHGRAQTVLRGVKRYSLGGRGRRARRRAGLPPRDAVARAGRLRRGVPPGGRRGADRPRLGRDPARARLVEVAPRHDRAARACGSSRTRSRRSCCCRSSSSSATGTASPARRSRSSCRRSSSPLAWVVILVRLRDELRASGGVGAPRAASS